MILKKIPEDFLVKEISNLHFDENGSFFYFNLKKKDFTTLGAIKLISKKTGINIKDIGYSGIKDRVAVTEQFISFPRKVKDFSTEGISISFVGKGNERCFPGSHKSNFFSITIRNISKKPEIKKKVLNLFGEQRFSKQNHIVGKLIIQKKFKDACNRLSFEAKVKNFLEEKPNECIGALRTLGIPILKLFVHSYQSFLWNKMAFSFKDKKDKEVLPLIGFATNKDKLILDILKEEDIDSRDFIIPQIPQISSEGGERNIWVDIKDLKIGDLLDDDLFPGSKKCIVEFILPKGSYATVAVAQLMNKKITKQLIL